jgi:Family of unknown function (DUF6141)
MSNKTTGDTTGSATSDTTADVVADSFADALTDDDTGEVGAADISAADITAVDLTALDKGATHHATEAPKPLMYREVQGFLWWVVVPVAVVTVVIWWSFVKQIVLHQPVGMQPIPDWLAWVLSLVFGLGLPALALSIHLVTEVRSDALKVRLVPFRTLVVPIGYIDSAAVREYSAVREYGGYGVRKGWLGSMGVGRRRNGWAYTARGKRGVQLLLTNGLLILVGSQQPEKLLTALKSAGGSLGPTRTSAKKRTRK